MHRLAFCFLLACGPSIPKEQLLDDLARAVEAPVADAEGSAQHSRVVQAAVDGDALLGLRRAEVEAEIGRGDECSRHARCDELGFESDDWFYHVGAMGGGYGGQVPLLIVGFDRAGTVIKVWNLRTHE
ncbi:MAG: hypothetical protein H6720_00110 [Sandaracinus sp.]|nr:hypothetical protein [Sandaracinus sp.]MCB9624954.1 hypothetical protein [Sandaracinus sp.]